MTRAQRLRGVSASACIGTAAAALRLWFVLAEHSPADHVFSDMWVYDHRARNLLSGQLTAWDTFTPCGYPWLLSLAYRAWPTHGPLAIGVLQALLGGATAALTHRIGLRLWRGGVAPVLAGALVAVHVPLVFYTGFLLTETVSAFAVALCTWTLLRAVERRAPGEFLWAGLCLGATAVVRPNILPFYALLVPWLWRALGLRRGAWALMFVVLGGLPLLGASAAHNSRLLDKPSLLGTNGGLNFYLNFSEVRTIRYRDRLNDHAITPLPSLMRHQIDERSRVAFYDDAYYYRRGVEQIVADPARLWRAARNLPDAAGLGPLTYWPGSRGYDDVLEVAARAFFYAGIAPATLWLLWLAALGGLYRPEHRAHALLACWLACSVLVAWLFLGDPRIRVPFDALWILLAVDAYAALLYLRRRKSQAVRA